MTKIIVIARRRHDDEAISLAHKNADWFASQLPSAVVILPRNDAFFSILFSFVMLLRKLLLYCLFVRLFCIIPAFLIVRVQGRTNNGCPRHQGRKEMRNQ